MSKSRSSSRSRHRREYENKRIDEIVNERLKEINRDLERTFLRLKTLSTHGIRTPADEKTAEKLMEDEFRFRCDQVIYERTKKYFKHLKDNISKKETLRGIDYIMGNQELRKDIFKASQAKTLQQKEKAISKVIQSVKGHINRHKGKYGVAAGAAAVALANYAGLNGDTIASAISSTGNLIGSSLQYIGNFLNPPAIVEAVAPIAEETYGRKIRRIFRLTK